MGTTNHSTGFEMVSGSIAALADQKRLTMKAVFEDSGIPESSFYRKLKHPHTFTLPELASIASALGMTLAALCEAAGL